jgi:hypothetical protein
MRRLLAVLTYAALRLVISFMIAVGGAALVAVVFVMRPPSSDWAEWIVPIRQSALGIGFAFLGAAVIALRLLPSRRELIRAASYPSERALPRGVLLLLAGLAGVSAWQFPMVLAWWGESRRLLEQLIAGERDPLGLWIIPAAMVSASPFIATLVVLLFILTAMAVAAARPPLAVRVLHACVLLQSGLVIGSSLALPPIRGLAARVLALAASGPDAGVRAAITQAVARQDFFATGLLSRFQWILGGYVLAALATWYWQPFRDAADDALPSSDVAPPLAVVPDAGALTAPAETASVSPTLSSVFGSSAYRVRLRTPWILAAFRVGYLDYAITPMPATVSDAGFSFSGKDGLFRREPAGPSLLTVRPEGRAWPFRTSYIVAEPSSGGIIGILEPVGANWNVLDRFRRPLAQVEEVDARRGYCRYCIRVDHAEVCRFIWAMHGFGVWTAEMDIEFSKGAARRLDPSYAMALAPILESQTRRTSQRMD